MRRRGRIWLVCNEASGSNDPAAVDAVEEALRAAGFSHVERRCFPDEPIPPIAELRASESDMLAVFAGDGTVSTALRVLCGWDGTVLVLPGGTMNYLARRLHGDARPDEIIARLDHGIVEKVRPEIILSRYGEAYTGITAGPGTVWNDVREALRHADILETVTNATQAIAESTQGVPVRSVDPPCGRDEGYAAITITPDREGLVANGYYADTLGDFMRQGVALLQRNFRLGPHERLGAGESWRLACDEGQSMGLLIDGEPCEADVEEVFTLGRCEVDLLRSADAA